MCKLCISIYILAIAFYCAIPFIWDVGVDPYSESYVKGSQ